MKWSWIVRFLIWGEFYLGSNVSIWRNFRWPWHRCCCCLLTDCRFGRGKFKIEPRLWVRGSMWKNPFMSADAFRRSHNDEMGLSASSHALRDLTRLCCCSDDLWTCNADHMRHVKVRIFGKGFKLFTKGFGTTETDEFVLNNTHGNSYCLITRVR